MQTTPCVEVRWTSGQVIDILPWSDGIDVDTDISWAIYVVTRQVNWPASRLSFFVGQRQFRYINPLAIRERTSLLELIRECVRNGSMGTEENAKLIVHVYRHALSDMFLFGSCICDFLAKDVASLVELIIWNCAVINPFFGVWNTITGVGGVVMDKTAVRENVVICAASRPIGIRILTPHEGPPYHY